MQWGCHQKFIVCHCHCNRRELLDKALLRPGRLEVHIYIPLPDKQGRREILHIHFQALRKRHRLSKPLCSAIDGDVSQNYNNNSTTNITSKRARMKESMKLFLRANFRIC